MVRTDSHTFQFIDLGHRQHTTRSKEFLQSNQISGFIETPQTHRFHSTDVGNYMNQNACEKYSIQNAEYKEK